LRLRTRWPLKKLPRGWDSVKRGRNPLLWIRPSKLNGCLVEGQDIAKNSPKPGVEVFVLEGKSSWHQRMKLV